MNWLKQSALFVGIAASGVVLPSLAVPQNTLSEEKFDSNNAILDTSVLFAIGAQEAQQSLRGSFGWPTFQEGLVEGVYFRFDPDGYARFSPAPRLDVDVFEVICRPRTFNCLARKGGLNVFLNARGQLQLKIDGIAAGDQFYISEGVTEIELPERILQPLDNRFEALLLAGGELIVRRGGEEFERVSLVGFSAASTYLRWVAARQDYTILPRGWPVPNSKADSSNGMTQPASWESPMPQPQVLTSNYSSSANIVSHSPQPNISSLGYSELAEVKSELSQLRSLLEGQDTNEAVEGGSLPEGFDGFATPNLSVPLGVEGALAERVARLEESLQTLNAPVPVSPTSIVPDMAFDMMPETLAPRDGSVSPIANLRQTLETDFFLAPQTVETIIMLASEGSGTEDSFLRPMLLGNERMPQTSSSFSPIT
ncbi:MAG: hypothetical protein ABJO67_00005, partial [Pseudoruegeria sp.]